jgi:hypothetical protein
LHNKTHPGETEAARAEGPQALARVLRKAERSVALDEIVGYFCVRVSYANFQEQTEPTQGTVLVV